MIVEIRNKLNLLAIIIQTSIEIPMNSYNTVEPVSRFKMSVYNIRN